MKEIFTDLYKKVVGFFQTQEKESGESKTVAVNRMKLVLMQDRTNLTPLLLERLRGEMIEVLSKYVEMDKEALELNFEQEGEQMALMLSIPVLRAKEEDEIKAILEEEDKEAENSTEEESAEDSEESEEIDADVEKSEESETEEAENEDDNEVCTCACREGEGCSCECEDLDDNAIEEETSEVEETTEEKPSNKKKKNK